MLESIWRSILSLLGRVVDGDLVSEVSKLSREEVEGELRRQSIAWTADHNGEVLDWQKSTRDLCKLLHVDDTLEGRSDMARQFGHKGKFTGTDEQGEWLHEQIIQHLRQPQALKELKGGGHRPLKEARGD